jgi:CRISPR-associated endoribonuclease Cas6
MLIAIVLVLAVESDVRVPAYLGRANYAAALRRIGEVDAPLAVAIHGGEGPKPLTCSGLLNMPYGGDERLLRGGTRCAVRVTGLTEVVTRALEACLLAARPQRWQLNGHDFPVEDVICDARADVWSGRASYAELAAAHLVRGERTEPTVQLQFASPTAFKSAGMTIPVPMPGLVFGSLVERWNAFSSVTISPEMRRYGDEVMAVSSYSLRSVAVVQKNQALRIGGLGDVTYRALGEDRYWRGVMHMLADFARFSGIGVQTATGMGQARRVR